jgi:3-hydroxy-9,10-secoandrosta-1,3,5(10)-triene-9,17-dione monooxygenase
MTTRNLSLVSSDKKSVVLERARALVPVLTTRAAETERTRRIPDETIADFQRNGLFRILQPARFGGAQLHFDTFAAVTRELARGCASSAWVYCVVEELFWVLATFPEKAQTEIWGENPAALACAALAPSGNGVIDGDGYRLTGQWQFLSGSDHASWVFLTASCDNGKGGRELRNFFVRAAELQFIDDWDTMGLRGTGSKSCKADNLYVPGHRSVRYDDVLAGTAPGAKVHPNYSICRAPRRYLTSFSITPVVVGLANLALEIVTDMLRSRLRAGASPEDFEVVQQKVAEGAAGVHTANLIMESYTARSVEALESGQPITEQMLAQNRLMAAHMLRTARDAVERLCLISGSRWVFNSHPMQVILRDALVGSTHRAFNWEDNARIYAQSIGLVRGGAPPTTP